MSSISLIASQARRTLSFAVWAVGLSVLAGCPQEPASVVCPGTGIICPENTYCGAVQPICLTTSCGNGIVDLNEQCDDGNILEGDNCSPICKREECGNNVLDPNEVCDDGNKANSDGCSANCMSKEVCGNTIVDIGEACDDGNATNGDGCSGTPQTVGMEMSPAPCKSTEVCGNGIKDLQVGEVCDDGNTVSGDHCNSNCQSGEGCGNGFVDPGEQCDDGNMNNGDDCLNTCRTAKCGDGVVDNTGTLNETCDAGTTGTPVETATCNIDCTTRSCGDRKVNQTAGEQCDDGLGVNGDTKNCTATCLLNRCGDGLVDMTPPVIEQCDDGNSNNTDGCSNACALASCGNSTVDMGEMCDDGNTNQTDACVMCHTAICGDGFTRAGVEQCDDGNTTNGDNCSSTCRIEVCGNMIIDPGELCDDGNSSNTDACTNGCQLAFCGDNFVRSGIEQCDDGNTVNGDLCSSQCRLEGCGNGTLDPGEQCDDSNTNPGDGCSATCRFEACGNGLLDPGEQCDDNNNVNTDSCNNCQNARCGDGVVRIGVEECDGGANCSANCTIQICGNGIIDPGEQCDDDNLVNGDGCSGNGHPLLNACKFEFCGDKLKGASETCDYTDIAVSASGNGACNRDCTTAACGDAKLSPFAPSNEQCDLGTVNNALNMGCSPACQLDHCGDGNPDGIEQCDNGTSNSANGPCLPWCRFATCGDGVVESASSTATVPSGVELCDNGPQNGATTCAYGLTSCTTCSATTCQPVTLNTAMTQTRFCGDGYVNSATPLAGVLVGPETCDNGTLGSPSFPANGSNVCPYNTSCTTCKTDCTGAMMPTFGQCGDGTVNGPTEKCDFGATNNTTTLPTSCPYNSSCTTCPAGCTTVTAVVSGGRCGDGNINSTPATGVFPVGPETCDNGLANTTDVDCPWASTMVGSMCTKCSTSCVALTTVPHYCGDGQCDIGFEVPGAGGCSADCGSGQFPLTVVKTGAGDGNITGGITCSAGSCTSATVNVNSGTMVTLTAGATAGNTFVGWGGACVAAGTMANCTVTVNAAMTATAIFGKVQRQVTVTKTGSGSTQGSLTVMPAGTANCGANCASYDDGSVIVVTATPGANNVVSWSGCDSMVGNVCIVTANGTETVVATFTLDTAVLSMTVAGAGSVTSSPAGISCPGTCSFSFDVGSTVTLTATPTGAGVFNGFTGDCTTTSCVMLPAGNAVTATFTP